MPLPIALLGQWRCTTAVNGLFVSSGTALLAIGWGEFSLGVFVGAVFFLVVALVSLLILVSFLVPPFAAFPRQASWARPCSWQCFWWSLLMMASASFLVMAWGMTSLVVRSPVVLVLCERGVLGVTGV